jgi:hypothetical protein
MRPFAEKWYPKLNKKFNLIHTQLSLHPRICKLQPAHQRHHSSNKILKPSRILLWRKKTCSIRKFRILSYTNYCRKTMTKNLRVRFKMVWSKCKGILLFKITTVSRISHLKMLLQITILILN